MESRETKPVLLIGGSGLVGFETARSLRRFHPGLPVAIGGRDLDKARARAEQLPLSEGLAVDLERDDLGLAERSFSAVVMFVKDERLAGLRYAQQRGIPYVDISTASFEIAPEVALFAQHPECAAIVLGGAWLVGAATLAALHFASGFASLERLQIAAVLDDEDIGGPAAFADFERQVKATTSAVVREQGRFVWLSETEGRRTFRNVDGRMLEARSYLALDVMALAAATGVESVRFDLALGISSGRLRGGPMTTEMVIELAGTDREHRPTTARHELVLEGGQAPLTALMLTLLVERLLGLGGEQAAAPGLYLPHRLLDPAYTLERMRALGVQHCSAPEEG